MLMMKKLNICIVTSEYPPYIFSGPGLYASNLVEMLVKQGHNVTVITPEFGKKTLLEKSKNLNIYRVKIIKSFLDKIIPNLVDRRIILGYKAKKMLMSKLSTHNYDIVHFMDSVQSVFIDKKFTQKYNVVVSLNDYYFFYSTWNIFKFPYFTTDFLLRYFHHNIIKHYLVKSLKFVKLVLANTKFVKDVANENVHNSNINIVHRGIDFENFNVTPSKQKYNSKKVLFVGGNMERKGAWTLLNSAKLVVSKFSDSKFIFIGRRSLFFKIRMNNFIKKHNLEKNIIHINYLSHKDLKSYYKEANVFVMPSIQEALGQVYMEGMSSKTPVIGSAVGGVSELITTDCGYLINPKDHVNLANKINFLFENPKIAKQMGDAGNKRIKKLFTKELMVKKTVELYQTIFSLK